MVVFDGFIILALVVGHVFRDVLAHEVSGLDEVVAQVAIASFGHATIFSFKVAGASTRPPQTSDLGDSIFSIAEVARTVTFAFAVPLVTLEKALNAIDLSPDPTGEDRANARDRNENGDVRIELEFGGDPVIGLGDLGFEETNVVESEIEDALDGKNQGVVKGEAFLGSHDESAGVFVRVWEMMTAEFIQMGGQVLHRQISEFVQSGILG
jgi:hypothetical protein